MPAISGGMVDALGNHAILATLKPPIKAAFGWTGRAGPGRHGSEAIWLRRSDVERGGAASCSVPGPSPAPGLCASAFA